MIKNNEKTRKVVALTAGLALIASITGCSNDTSAKGSDKLEVAATTTQIQDFVTHIAGNKVRLHGLFKPGVSAHSFDPSPSELAALGDADLLILNGAELDDFIEPSIEASGFKGKTIKAAEGIDKARAKAETAAAEAQSPDAHNDHADSAEHPDEHHVEHGEHGENHEHSDAAHENSEHHAHEDEHHHHGEINPHIWTSPEFARQMVEHIAAELIELDPKNADTYRKNADEYTGQLKELSDWAKAEFEKVDPQKRKFVSSHNSLLYYLNDNNIDYIGSVIPSFEDNAEPSAAEINTLVENIKKENVPAVFIESSVSGKLGETVAKEAGVPVVQKPIYADSLAASGQAANYIGATISNTLTILDAWGYKNVSVPSSLQQ